MEMPSVIDAAAMVRTGDVSAAELVRESLDAIERDNEALNAFVFVDAPGALAEAARVDAAGVVEVAQRLPGLLHGAEGRGLAALVGVRGQHALEVLASHSAELLGHVRAARHVRGRRAHARQARGDRRARHAPS